MLTSTGSVKLINFGVSKLISKKTNLTEVEGILDYMAPEVIEGVGYNHKADLWSVGVVLYKILFGRLPFSDGEKTEAIEVIENIKTANYL